MLVLAAVLVPGTAMGQSKTYTCSFTEPFVRTVFDTHAGTMIVIHDVEKRRETLRGLSVSKVDGETVEVRGAGKKAIQRLARSYNGTDGMSDRVYPYEVIWTPGRRSLPATLYGGCESDTEKAK